MKSLSKLIGEKIKEMRLSKSLTQQKLAKRIGTDKSYIGHLENGLKIPSLKLIDKLSKQFRLPYGYFFDDTLSPREVSRINPKVKRILDRIKGKKDKQLDIITGFLNLLEKI